ncbi:MAG: hypothetical protein HY015_05880 [Bacteroidetes bacterium]|nr:hypothetical protein [Bacteroidota bacterium]
MHFIVVECSRELKLWKDSIAGDRVFPEFCSLLLFEPLAARREAKMNSADCRLLPELSQYQRSGAP